MEKKETEGIEVDKSLGSRDLACQSLTLKSWSSRQIARGNLPGDSLSVEVSVVSFLMMKAGALKELESQNLIV